MESLTDATWLNRNGYTLAPAGTVYRRGILRFWKHFPVSIYDAIMDPVLPLTLRMPNGSLWRTWHTVSRTDFASYHGFIDVLVDRPSSVQRAAIFHDEACRRGGLWMYIGLPNRWVYRPLKGKERDRMLYHAALAELDEEIMHTEQEISDSQARNMRERAKRKAKAIYLGASLGTRLPKLAGHFTSGSGIGTEVMDSKPYLYS